MTGLEIEIAEAIALVAIGLGAGFMAGLLGVGGGILLVPAMVLLMGFEQHVAQGTSLVVVIPAALTGSITHYRRGSVSLRDAAALAIGGVLGAFIGAVFALALEGETLRRLFAVFLLLTAARMAYATIRRGRPS
jgi:uncharacterized protein